MGFFDKVTQTASKAGKSVIASAGKVCASVATAAHEQSELVQLKSQLNVINQELDAFYIQIGKRYIDYVLETGEMPGIDASDLLKLIDPKMVEKEEVEQKIIELEKEIKEKSVLRDKQQAEKDYLTEKSKLDKALSMDIISQDDYEIRLAIARKKYDNFEEIRRIQQQADIGLITNVEKDAKIKELTE